RPRGGCTIFLGFTSNLVGGGVREGGRYLVQHGMVDVLVTTAGGVGGGLIKGGAPTYIGDFHLRGRGGRESGGGRIGNRGGPNDRGGKFEDWLMPILDQGGEEQEGGGVQWTPSRMGGGLGKGGDHPESVCYWAQKGGGDMLSPALTDGSLGGGVFFQGGKRPGLVLDIVEEGGLINTQAIFAHKTGGGILGGGVVKHHIANANLMGGGLGGGGVPPGGGNGADFSVYVNTGGGFDGWGGGARPDEAVSWGKGGVDATGGKVYAEGGVVFPGGVAETFARSADAFGGGGGHG
ncbi:DHYS synthase, partial [Neopipo cinnamomea]|nr:DHYS synthase [Neopipo cinnamomea]